MTCGARLSLTKTVPCWIVAKVSSHDKDAHNSVGETDAECSSNTLQPFQAPIGAADGKAPLRLTPNSPVQGEPDTNPAIKFMYVTFPACARR